MKTQYTVNLNGPDGKPLLTTYSLTPVHFHGIIPAGYRVVVFDLQRVPMFMLLGVN